jgi:hypothetical protein
MSALSFDEAMLARIAIQHTLSVYNSSGDQGRIEALAQAFTPQGVLEVPGDRFEGRAAIVAFLSGIAAGGGETELRGSRHNLTTSRIEFDDAAAARGWTYFFVMRAGVVIQSGVYIDRFEKLDAEWLIAHRRVKVEFSAASSATG